MIEGKHFTNATATLSLMFDATVCIDVWSSVWQAVDVDVRVRES